jgi:hypothetical protein
VRVTKVDGEVEERIESTAREGHPVHLTTQLQFIQVLMRLHGLGVEDAPNPVNNTLPLARELRAEAERPREQFEALQQKSRQLAKEAKEQSGEGQTEGN